MNYVIAAPTIGGRLSIMFTGTRYECQRYVRNRVRLGLPTHFCYMARDTYRALSALAKRLGIEKGDCA